MEKEGEELLFFTGTECTHCHAMEPLVERLEKEENLKVKRLEVWHDSKNKALLQKYDRGYCGGIPFFFNTRTGKWICGETDFENLKKWALRK